MWFGKGTADESKLPLPELVRKGQLSNVVTFVRDIPYSAEALLENVGDSVHLHWAHRKARIMFNCSRGGAENGLVVESRESSKMTMHWGTVMLTYFATFSPSYR